MGVDDKDAVDHPDHEELLVGLGRPDEAEGGIGAQALHRACPATRHSSVSQNNIPFHVF